VWHARQRWRISLALTRDRQSRIRIQPD
jgi:hypothetical protein